MLKELLTTFVVSASATGISDTTGIDIHQDYSYNQAECLAQNMYHEAKNQGFAGQLAVALVVLNRVNDHRFPNTICEVVHQGPVKESWKTKGKDLMEHERIYYPIRHRCQFSWYCDGKGDIPRQTRSWTDSQQIADYIMNKPDLIDITDGATHYHADYINPPRWALKRQMTLQIDTHIFYNKTRF